jgi:pimeloyl-ACP methyl ester carboxylesterase
MFKSAYVPFFLMPRVPEFLLSRFGYLGVRLMLQTAAARTGVFTRADLACYVEAISQPGALTSGLNYYRANARGGNEPPVERVEAPTLVIWGERDPALGIRLLDGLDRFVPRLRLERLPGVGHWVQNEAPEDVSRLMVSFVRE